MPKCEICGRDVEEAKARRLSPRQLTSMEPKIADTSLVALHSTASSMIMFNNPPGSADTPIWWVCLGCLSRCFAPGRTAHSLKQERELYAAVTQGSKEKAPSGEFFRAVMKGDIEVARKLLDTNPQLVDARESRMATPLHIASFMENEEMVRLLLSRGASPKEVDADDGTPLHCAAVKRNMAVAELLLTQGANPNAEDKNGSTPMSLAIPEGSVYIFRYQRTIGPREKPRDILELLEYHGAKPPKATKRPWWKIW